MKLKHLIFLSVFLSASAQSQVTTECSSSDADADGDGYGWENNASCIVSTSSLSTSECIDTLPLNDGWGWNGSESCRVSTPASSNDECLDSDGDGWGWDGTSSCIVSVDAVVNTDDAVASSCIDSDGDGWGWTGTESCLVSDTNTIVDDSINRVDNSTQYSIEEIDRFVNLATLNEFSGNRNAIFKYPDGASITWSINGTYTTDSYDLGKLLFAELSSLTDLSFTEVNVDADIEIYFVAESDFNQTANAIVPDNNSGYFQFNYYYSTDRADYTIADAIILIDKDIDQLAQDHLLREEVTQSLGLANDDYEPDSMFYQIWSYTQEFSDSDKTMLDIMYRSGIVGGMNYNEVYDYFGF